METQCDASYRTQHNTDNKGVWSQHADNRGCGHTMLEHNTTAQPSGQQHNAHHILTWAGVYVTLHNDDRTLLTSASSNNVLVVAVGYWRGYRATEIGRAHV